MIVCGDGGLGYLNLQEPPFLKQVLEQRCSLTDFAMVATSCPTELPEIDKNMKDIYLTMLNVYHEW